MQIGLDHLITGVFDALLDQAVRDIKAHLGVVADGIVGPVTWAALPTYRETSPTLAHGSTGPVVGWLQLSFSGDNIGHVAAVRPGCWMAAGVGASAVHPFT